MFFLFFNAPATPKIYTLSLHDALPISVNQLSGTARPMKLTSLYSEFAELRLILRDLAAAGAPRLADVTPRHLEEVLADRKSTRLNSSHVEISYAVFCLKKKKKNIICNQ